MDMFATTVLNPRSFVMQDHEATNHLHYFRKLMGDPVIRRDSFFLTFWLQLEKSRRPRLLLNEKKLVQNTM